MPTPAFVAPLVAGVASAAVGGGIQAAMKPGGPPEIDETRKKNLGTFAERLAQEAQEESNAGGQGFVFGRNTRPVSFSSLRNNFDRPLMLQS